MIWPAEAALDAESIGLAAELATAELARNGTTAILDMGTTHHADALAAVVERSGLRATLGPALMDQGPDAARPLLTSAEEALASFERFAARFDGAGDGRLSAALCPRFVPSVSETPGASSPRAPTSRASPFTPTPPRPRRSARR
ncbi:MAG: amidohydrolase family protein [Candidatus Eisenbacteria bacterium]